MSEFCTCKSESTKDRIHVIECVRVRVLGLVGIFAWCWVIRFHASYAG